MIVQAIRRFAGHDEGAIAPIYALALFGLVGMAGVGFDYARLMTLDTELQNAADQLAIAAATQLDEQTDSITRAESAARNYFASTTSDYSNITRISNIDDDSDGKAWFITNVSFQFWEDYDRASDAPQNLIADKSDGSDAHVVEVTVAKRGVQFALTPIVGAIAGNAGAVAMASMESAYCKVPPMMVCVPNPQYGAYNPVTDTVNNRGEGARLHMLPNADSDDLMPSGLFGFLDFPYPGPGGNPNTTLGWNVLNPGCTGENVEAEPGARDSEDEALNTRFDLYRGSAPACDTSTGNFCPSKNTTKDMLVQASTTNNTTAADAAAAYAVMTNADCPNPNTVGKNDWLRHEDIVASGVDVTNLRNPGYPRDTCHLAGGSCAGSTFGDGVWNIANYMATAHPDLGGSYPAGLSSSSSRYDVYKWEATDANADGVPDNLPTKLKSGYTLETTGGGNMRARFYCAYPRPRNPANGIAPPATLRDRRILSVAAVNCSGVKANSEITILRYIDMFLVRPSKQGGDKEFYVEVIGEDPNQLANNSFQYYAKKKAVLIR